MRSEKTNRLIVKNTVFDVTENIIFSVLKVSIFIITNVTYRSIGLVAILVIMSVSALITSIYKYIEITTRNNPEHTVKERAIDIMLSLNHL